MSNHYIIDPQTLAIISGPHNIMATEIKKATSCGNPDLLENEYLVTFGVVPEVVPALDPETQTYDGVSVTASAVTKNIRSLTQEELLQKQQMIISNLSAVVQNHLDAVAQSRYYDSILSVCSYATSKSKKFGPEGIAAVLWRDAVWEYLYGVMADCQAGTRTIPTAEELLAEIPQMVWPDGMVAALIDGVLTEQENASFTGTLWTSIKSFFGF